VDRVAEAAVLLLALKVKLLLPDKRGLTPQNLSFESILK
jgi:hypothetical protein